MTLSTAERTKLPEWPADWTRGPHSPPNATSGEGRREHRERREIVPVLDELETARISRQAAVPTCADDQLPVIAALRSGCG
jgi:hypothetical protein